MSVEYSVSDSFSLFFVFMHTCLKATLMRMKFLHLETGKPGEAVHSRPLFEVEMDDDDEDMVKMAKEPNEMEEKGGRGGKIVN